MTTWYIHVSHLKWKLKNFNEVLTKSVAAGGLQVSGYHSEKKTYLQKIDQLSKGIKVKTKKYNG